MKNILLVDDEQQTISVFQAALSAAGYNVVTADNGATAFAALKAQKFDLVVLDEIMPDMSGNDAIKAIKADDTTKHLPIVILTNYGDDDLVKQALNQGATDYILKYQMTPNDLSSKIKMLIGE